MRSTIQTQVQNPGSPSTYNRLDLEGKHLCGEAVFLAGVFFLLPEKYQNVTYFRSCLKKTMKYSYHYKTSMFLLLGLRNKNAI